MNRIKRHAKRNWMERSLMKKMKERKNETDNNMNKR